MCKECMCCFEEEEITKEDVIQVVAGEIVEGGCLGRNLEMLFDIAYDMGKQDLARESRDFYQDVLDEEV